MMKRIIPFFVFLFSLSVSGFGQDIFEEKPAFEEHFTSKEINKSIWGFSKEQSGSLPFYNGDNKRNVKVKKGKLYLTLRKNSPDEGEKSYTSGRLYTKKFYRYGKFEIRAKMPSINGIWAAIWFRANWSRTKDGPACRGEVDLMECFVKNGNYKKWNVNVHLWGNIEGKTNSHSQYPYSVMCDISKYHVYTLEIAPNKVVFKIEGNIVRTVRRGDIPEWPFGNNEYQLLLALSYGGWDKNKITNDARLPQTMKVDYVKYYKLKGEYEND